jgi:hypothetical protein
MPSPEISNLIHTAVLWAASGTDSYGQPTLSTPQEIRCRLLGTRSWTMDADRNSILLDAKLITLVDVPLGSQVWLGQLTTWNSLPTGTLVELYEVKTFSGTPDLKGRVTRREAGLMKVRSQK